jgi:hypothetical protein
MNEKKTLNDISLKEYFETRLRDLEKATTIVASNLEKSTAIAASAMERRLEGMNEFRNQLKDQTSTFVVRSEYNSTLSRLNEDIRVLRESKATMDGKASQMSTNISTIIAIIGLIISLVGFFRYNFTPVSSNMNFLPTPSVQGVK